MAESIPVTDYKDLKKFYTKRPQNRNPFKGAITTMSPSSTPGGPKSVCAKTSKAPTGTKNNTENAISASHLFNRNITSSYEIPFVYLLI